VIRRRAHGVDPRSAAGQLKALVGEQPAFVEGLLLGAMVGAAIAGSTVWARLRDRRRHAAEDASEPARQGIT
jgi:hypothetical protein